MRELFITKLILKNIRNLDYREIPLSEKERKHVIFTGKNGSGKTTILDGLSRIFDRIGDTNFLSEAEPDCLAKGQQVSDKEAEIAIELNAALKDLYLAFEEGRFILAYYKADRIFLAEIPKHVEKVELKRAYLAEDRPRESIVKYLLDLKMTQALAASGGKKEKAEHIQKWFDQFEHLLQEIFEEEQLCLQFDEDTFCFYIKEPGKKVFDFNTLSSGYAAVLDIVVDLMIRMEQQTKQKFQYDLPGVVLIDEIETHLHLELQKKILKFLSTVFPNIQFIVTTHSPFVLNSLENVVIYDLEQQLLVERGLADVPYDGIVEGYFGASLLSETLQKKFERYKSLVKKDSLTDEDVENLMNMEGNAKGNESSFS